MCCSWKSAPSLLFLPPSYLSHSRVFQKKKKKRGEKYILLCLLELVLLLYCSVASGIYAIPLASWLKMDFQSSKQYIFLIAPSSVKYQVKGSASFFLLFWFNLSSTQLRIPQLCGRTHVPPPQPAYFDPINLSREGGESLLSRNSSLGERKLWI